MPGRGVANETSASERASERDVLMIGSFDDGPSFSPAPSFPRFADASFNGLPHERGRLVYNSTSYPIKINRGAPASVSFINRNAVPSGRRSLPPRNFST